MTVLCFADLNSLQLTLTSGVVPAAVSVAPVVAGFDDDGHVWVKPSAALPRAAEKELRRLGVQIVKSIDGRPTAEFSCWPQLLPLQREANATVPGGSTPVLFELPRPADLPAITGEILRLGNDRQAFRWVRDDHDSSVLLRVIGPPYYSLLRALDRDGQAGAPRAYVERAPGVWIEIGHTHPLLGQLKAPAGKLILLRPSRDWVYLDEVPYRDIYEILEFALPDAEVRWRDATLQQAMKVPLRLAPSGSQDPAELWVLRERPVAALDAFVRSADDHLLGRLSFAVGEGVGGAKIVVLRVRPSRLPPPVLPLQATEFRPYLKLPNLFMPQGWRLHPPLRRDAVRKLFAEDPDQVTWLFPHEDGTFTPEGLPDSVFRPLADWIDYVLDHDRAALQGWMQSMQFEFEPFVCRDDQDPRPTRDREKKDRGREVRARKEHEAAETAEASLAAVQPGKGPKQNAEAAEPLPELSRATPTELQLQLAALERRFLELEGGLDARARQALWPQLALLNTALDHFSDAGLCWTHALWGEDGPVPQHAWGWVRTENRERAALPGARDIDQILNSAHDSLADVRLLAAYTVAAAAQEPPPAELVRRLRPVQEFLQQHEALLPVRAVWLVALALYKLSHGDLLALTRTRDRLLERLFQGGLNADKDLPTFLRFAGGRASDRFRTYRDWLLLLPDRIRRWIRENPCKDQLAKSNEAETEGYAHLILAFGLARLGEEQRARQLHVRARETLGETDDVHTCLLEAFGFRLQQALDGKPASGPLPREVLEYLEAMDPADPAQRIMRYKVDRLRQHSRILEPHEKINPYRSWQARFFDDLEQKLATLCDVIDRGDLEQAVRGLLDQTRGQAVKEQLRRTRVVREALSVAPRVGEAFAKELLAETLPACAVLDDALAKAQEATEKENLLMEQAELIEKGMLVAAHFDQAAHVQTLVGRFQSLLAMLQGTAGGAPLVDRLAEQSFRGLRKLGMRDEIHALLGKMAEVVTGGKALADLRTRKDWGAVLRTLLHVASGWYYFGVEDEARPIMDEARLLLCTGDLDSREQTKLACAYATTLGQAPADLALQSINELFQKLERITDTFATNTHYALSQLEVIEAVVLAVVTEDFALGSTARRWLDDEEFLIRRRVHHDVQTLMNQAHL